MRASTYYAFVIVGGLLLADSAVVLAVGGGINAGTLLPGAAGVGLLAACALVRRPGGGVVNAWNRRMTMALGLLLLAGLVPFLAVEGLIAASAFPSGVAPARWLLVLGAGLRGGTPSLTLQRRLNTALDHLQRNPDTQAILSGGKGHGETMSEAEAMSRFLTQHGIAPERLIKEERATSTFENLCFSKEILDAEGITTGETVNLISSDFHLFRVKFLARRVGLHVAAIAAPSPWYLLPNTCTREFLAVVKSFLADR